MSIDIDDRLREMVLGGAVYQARELAHALDLAEWAELLDLLLDHWHVKQGEHLWSASPEAYLSLHLTRQQCEAVVQHNNRFNLLRLECPYNGRIRVPYKAHKCGRAVLHKNPDIRARVIAEAAP